MSGFKKELERSRKYHGGLATVALLSCTAALPIFYRAFPALLILTLSIIAIRYWPPALKKRVNIFRNPVLSLAALFYLVHVLGCLWTANMPQGLFNLQVKLPLLVLPVFFVISRNSWIGGRLLQLTFVYASSIAVILSLCVSTYLLFTVDSSAHWFLRFYSGGFTHLIHPSYLGMFLTAALLIWYLKGYYADHSRFVQLALPLTLILGVLLSGSKAAWLIALLAVPSLLVYFRHDRRLRVTVGSLMLLMILGGVGTYAVSEHARYRVDELIGALKGSDDNEADPSDSSGVRKAVWKVSREVFTANPLTGVGTGDVQDVLVKEYDSRGLRNAFEKKLNAHSQYVQSAVALGVLGLFCLVLWLAVSLYHSFRNADYTMFAIVLLFALNIAVESMLEVQAGVLFFAWITFILSFKE